MTTKKINVNENLIRLVLVGIAGLLTFLITSYFNGFITRAEHHEIYKPETLVKKDNYQADKIKQTAEVTALKINQTIIKSDVKIIKADIKLILKEIRK